MPSRAQLQLAFDKGLEEQKELQRAQPALKKKLEDLRAELQENAKAIAFDVGVMERFLGKHESKKT